MSKILLSLVLTGAMICAGAQDVLFYTDFLTTPAGFAAASAAATAKGGDLDLVVCPVGSLAPKDTIIDGCTVSANNSGGNETRVVISKATQKPVAAGDGATATAGRLSLKNSKNYIAMPSVTGPCTITYHAAGSSAAGKGISCEINGMDIPEAGFFDLALNGVQATRKMVYSYATEGPVVFKLICSGGVYIYDIKITSGVTSVRNAAVSEKRTGIRITDLTIVNDKKAQLRVFDLAGSVIMTSNSSRIDLRSLVKGKYMVRSANSSEPFTFIR